MKKIDINWAYSYLGLEPEPLPDEVLFGQDAAREQIEAFLDTPTLPSILLTGEPGIGKTHFARWVATQRTEQYEELMCPVAPHQVPYHGIVMLDECHRQTRPEWLFPIMEKRQVTIFGATTRPEKLEPAFASRFFIRLHLQPLTDEAMESYVQHLWGDHDAVPVLAKAAAGNPRQAERLVMTAQGLKSEDAEQILKACRINADGLSELQLRYLIKMGDVSRPLGLAQLATLLYTDEQTLREAERHLIDLNLIDLGPNGRHLTKQGKNYVHRTSTGKHIQ